MDDDRKTYEHRKSSLFKDIDQDGSGQIDQSEFSKLYDLIKTEAQAELAKEAELASKTATANRKVKILSMIAIAMAAFLAVSVAANFAVMFYVVDGAVKTSANSSAGTLTVKGSNEAAVVGSMKIEADDGVDAAGTVALGPFGQIIATILPEQCNKAILMFEQTGETTVNTNLKTLSQGTDFGKVTVTGKTADGYKGTTTSGLKLLMVQNAGGDCDVYMTTANPGVTAGTGRRKMCAHYWNLQR